MTEKTLSQLLDLLRLKGVLTYEGPTTDGTDSVVKVTLGLSVDNIEDAKPGTVLAPDACRCGHPMFAHMNGACIQGCTLEQCAPPATAKEV